MSVYCEYIFIYGLVTCSNKGKYSCGVKKTQRVVYFCILEMNTGIVILH